MRPTSRILELSALAAAVVGAFSPGSAFGAQQIIGAGASAANASLQYVVLKDYCANGIGLTYTDNGTAPTQTTAVPYTSPAGSVWRITCTSTSTSKFTSGLDISYDTAGGSWKALTAVAPSMLTVSQATTANPYPVATVLTGGGTCLSNYVAAVNGANFTFTYCYGASTSYLPTSTTVSFGFTDVEPGLFQNPFDEPLVNSTWDGTNALVAAETPAYSPFPPVPAQTAWTGSAGTANTPYPAFGSASGVAASPKLYSALQTDQIATGLLPSACSGSSATSCAPFISRGQYASLIGGVNALTGGTSGIAPLFNSIVPTDTTIEIARRDQGSGAAASANAYFLGVGCLAGTEAPNPPLLPADIGVNPGGAVGTELPLFYSYNSTSSFAITRIVTPVSSSAPPSGGTITASNPIPPGIPGVTGSLYAQPGPSSGFVIGVIQANYASKLTGGAGFLRLDGFYPNTANAQAGLYGYVTTENFYGNSAATGDARTMIIDLLGVNGVPANETLAGFSGTGYVQFSASKYTGNAQLCTGWVHS